MRVYVFNMLPNMTYPPMDAPTPSNGASGYNFLICDTTWWRSSVFAAQNVLGVCNEEQLA